MKTIVPVHHCTETKSLASKRQNLKSFVVEASEVGIRPDQEWPLVVAFADDPTTLLGREMILVDCDGRKATYVSHYNDEWAVLTILND